MNIDAMAVFCGSKLGANPLYEEHTRQLGSMLAQRKIKVVYGGGNKGLMGTVANAALAEQGIVLGIIPKILSEREHQHNGLSEITIVETMHQRKKMLYEKCDAAIILPGGFGTLDEVFELLTWNQLSIHNKTIFILNTAGFYDALIEHIEKMQEEGFLYGLPADSMTILETPQALSKYL